MTVVPSSLGRYRYRLGLIIAIIGIAALSTVGVRAISVPFGVVFILVIPGLALLTVISPKGRGAAGVIAVFWIIAVSFTVEVLLGVLLNSVWTLDRSAWLIVEAAFSVLIVIGGQVRELVTARNAEAAERPTALRETAAAGLESGNRRWRRGDILTASLVAVAALGLCGAVVLSIRSLDGHSERTVETWMLPQPLASGTGAKQIQLGIQNNLDHEIVVNVTFYSSGGGGALTRTVDVKPDRTWTLLVTRPSSSAVDCKFVYSVDGHEVSRLTYIGAQS